ncbi:MAG TPA: HigA family addiction module antitoxin [bacterium]|nr:HigA family addiction module antitoxin [bacterium]
MIDEGPDQLKPNYVAPPGDTLLETIQYIGLSQAELARRMGRPTKTVNEIIKGKAAITSETALQLESVLGIPASFWNNLEKSYREFLAREQERERMQRHVEWVKNFPVRAMIKLGWIKPATGKIERLQEVLKFYGAASPEAWRNIGGGFQVSFRRSRALAGDHFALSAWLRRGEILAQSRECAPFEKVKFQEALALARFLTTTEPPEFLSELDKLCAGSGVVLLFVPELPGSRVCGATRWLSPRKAMIQLSNRYKTNDHMWFTFFHEAAHLLLHGKRDVFVDEENMPDDRKEKEADADARNRLIPESAYQAFISKGTFSRDGIRRFAKEQGIAPGIVVGRLQHDGELSWRDCNDLKERFELV